MTSSLFESSASAVVSSAASPVAGSIIDPTTRKCVFLRSFFSVDLTLAGGSGGSLAQSWIACTSNAISTPPGMPMMRTGRLISPRIRIPGTRSI